MPGWFLEKNVKTEIELRDIQTKIAFSNDRSKESEPRKIENKDELHIAQDSSSSYEVSSEFYDEALDITGSTLRSGPRGELPFIRSPSLLLRASFTDTNDFAEVLLQQLAKDMGANLISFGLEDLADLATEFDCQYDSMDGASIANSSSRSTDLASEESAQCNESDMKTPTKHDRSSTFGLAKFYFGRGSKKCSCRKCTERIQGAIDSVLDAPLIKDLSFALLDSTGTSETSTRARISPPVFVHLRSAKDMVINEEEKLILNFRKRVQQRYDTDENVVLFVSVSTESPPFYRRYDRHEPNYKEEMLHEMLLVDHASIIDVSLSDISKPLDLPAVHAKQDTVAINIRRLKRYLRSRFPPQFCPDLWIRHSDWESVTLYTKPGGREGCVWSKTDIECIARQIRGRRWKKPNTWS